MITLNLLYFTVMAIFFFGMTLMVKKNFYKFAIPLNVLFLVATYAFMVMICGIPKPMQYNLPFFHYEHLTGANIGQVVAGSIDNDHKLIYLVMKEGTSVRLYSFKATDEFLGEINKAVQIAKGFQFKMSVDTVYGKGTEPHVPMGQFQKNMNTIKTPENLETGDVEDRKID